MEHLDAIEMYDSQGENRKAAEQCFSLLIILYGFELLLQTLVMAVKGSSLLSCSLVIPARKSRVWACLPLSAAVLSTSLSPPSAVGPIPEPLC